MYAINSIEQCKGLAQQYKYMVFFFFDSKKMTLSDFLANVRALLPYTIKDGNHRYARFDINDVPIPKENFGFVASNGVLFYRDNTYVTYMSGFIPDVFSVMLQELPNLALLDIKKSNWISRYISPYSKVTVPGTASTVVSANSTTIVSDYNGSKVTIKIKRKGSGQTQTIVIE